MKILLLIAFCFLSQSCATILGGHETIQRGSETITGDKVAFDSNPRSAEIYVDGELLDYTPCARVLKHTKDHIITFKLANYDSEERTIYSRMQSGWIAADIICGILPLFVDALTQDWNFLDKASLLVEVRPATHVQPTDDEYSRVTALEKLAKLKADGVITEEEFKLEKEKILNAKHN
jgi:predicted acylesterase/phospholipase RssA